MTDREKLCDLLTDVFGMSIGAKADHLIANGVTFATDKNVGHWIPVTERLPETFGEYLVAVKDVSGQVYSDYADYDPFRQKWTTGLFLGVRDKITHWMPLPEPPKEVE